MKKARKDKLTEDSSKETMEDQSNQGTQRMRVQLGKKGDIDPNEILIFFKPRSAESESSMNQTDEPNEPPEEPPDEEQLILHRKMEESLTEYLRKMGHNIPPEKPVKK